MSFGNTKHRFALILPLVWIGLVLLPLFVSGMSTDDLICATFPISFVIWKGKQTLPYVPNEIWIFMGIMAPVVQYGWIGLLLDLRISGRNARKDGRCLNCGYDLRGSPGPICSECGTEF